MSSTRVALVLSLSVVAACTVRRPCPACPACPTATPALAATPPAHVAARPPSAPRPRAPAVAAAAPISGELPAITVADLDAAGALTCPPACAVDAETKRLYDDERADAISQEGASDGPRAVASFLIVRPGATLAAGRHERVDLLGVVLAGRASVALAESGRVRQVLEPWTAFCLPEGGLTVHADGDAPVAVALVRATDEPHELHALTGARVRGRARGGLVVRPLGAVADLAWAGGAFHARIAFEAADSPRASLGVLIGSPDAQVAEHDHPESWELLAALRASGALRVPGQPVPNGTEGARVAEHDRAVTNGSVILVPPGIRHAWRPSRERPLFAVQSYAPPGPEQRFRALASAPPP